ncbi:MAG: hypothetical protein AAF514_23595, partial [Verrucomicrobiota bacterium]
GPAPPESSSSHPTIVVRMGPENQLTLFDPKLSEDGKLSGNSPVLGPISLSMDGVNSIRKLDNAISNR